MEPAVWHGLAQFAAALSESTQTGTCTLPGDITIFAAIPHMHQLGTHMMTRGLPVGGEALPILDQDYSFDQQTVKSFDTPLHLKQGDTIEVNCTYDNPGDTTIAFGQSSNAEMCYTGFYWYPPLGGPSAFCNND